MVTRERKDLVRSILEEIPEKDRRILRAVFLEDVDKSRSLPEIRRKPGLLEGTGASGKNPFSRRLWIRADGIRREICPCG